MAMRPLTAARFNMTNVYATFDIRCRASIRTPIHALFPKKLGNYRLSERENVRSGSADGIA